ncbi:MAG: TIGR04282 family arsenosugar biosynthesis glycosyltransferase [Bacteroidota bacterium]
MSKDLLIIFTRNPELGKCKTRLAASLGDETALSIYKFLLNHTVAITQNLKVDKQVHYSVKVRENDIWDPALFAKKQQKGSDLGERMLHAFHRGFEEGYERLIIIGSDMYDMDQADLEEAFEALKSHDFVIGPATDGGYYLLGMSYLKPELFSNKQWGTETVLNATLENLIGVSLKVLTKKNDIDYAEDLEGFPVFDQFITKKK